MGSAFKNVFFHLFSVNPHSTKKGHGHKLVSLNHNGDDKVFLVYTKRCNKFKSHETPISRITDSKFYNFSTSTLGPNAYTDTI